MIWPATIKHRALCLPLVGVLALANGCSEAQDPAPANDTPLSFLGSESCSTCHQEAYRDWRGSHHQLAMQVANAETVLGDFSDVTFRHFSTKARMFTRDGKFFVVTENADNQAQEFEVTHTFGVSPLQQYLVDAPGGRKQALQVVWDARPESQGGQRWYPLYAEENIAADDPLHWTGRYFNWNIMCAECHSTNLKTGFDIASNSFDTSYSEISVGCEACHGPGSAHVQQAERSTFDSGFGLLLDLDDNAKAAWVMNSATGIAERVTADQSESASQQTETCGRCHARRSVIAAEYEYGKPLADTHLVSLLEENLYHADGRIQDEVYVYGSFVQSKMYAAGVTCSDCHNPHSGELHAGPDPNDTCATCHSPDKFAAATHAPEQIGDCVSCHMPATTYMGIDDRRDHSFRLPGTSDDPSHYGQVIAAGRSGESNAPLLAGIANKNYPAIARATMLGLLGPVESNPDLQTLVRQLDDPDALVRIGALRALRNQSANTRLRAGSHLLRDTVRAVRLEAVTTYADLRDLLPHADRTAFEVASDEYRAALSAVAAMPEAALNLAEFEASLGNLEAAEGMFEHAAQIGKDVPLVNYAYGMFLVRSGDSEPALPYFARAAELAPDVARFAYVYGVALNTLGNPSDALAVLETAFVQFPEEFDVGWALATISRDLGNSENARRVAKLLQARFPDRPEVQSLLDSLR